MAVMLLPGLLLLGAIGLLIDRWWSVLFALVSSTRALYVLGYLPWTAVSFALDIPMFSREALRRVWLDLSTQNRAEFILGVVIFLHALILSYRFLRRCRFRPGGRQVLRPDSL